MKINVLDILKKYYKSGTILAVVLWLMVWATYNTDSFRIFVPGFPHNLMELLHGIRSFMPFIALAIAAFLLIKNKKNINFKSPLGFMALYALVGIFASALSQNVMLSLYWGLLYISAIAVLFAFTRLPDSLLKTDIIIRLNWIIAAAVSLGIMLEFLIQPGVFSLEVVVEFLRGARPFENLAGTRAETLILGMAGTRPTGLGRYAGLVAIVMLANILRKNKKSKIIFSVLFALFFSILLFSRARTSMLAFAVAALAVLWFSSKSKMKFVFVSFATFLLLLPTNIYIYSEAFIFSKNLSETQEFIKSSNQNNSGQQDIMPKSLLVAGNNESGFNVKTLTTLSGRSTKIWPNVLSVFATSPIIGRGFDADRIFLNGLHAHNAWLQALIQSGIIGTIFFVLAFLWLFVILAVKIKKNPEKIILWEIFGAIAFFLVRSITESFAYFGADYLFLIPAVAFLSFSAKENLPGKEEGAMHFFGLTISLLSMENVLNNIKQWVRDGKEKTHWIVVTGMHGVAESEKNKKFKDILSHSDLFVPDGISLVWVGKIMGYKINKRVSGADLMKKTLEMSEAEGFKNYFYGDTDETLKSLVKKYPNIKTDFYSPPFRQLSKEEDEEIIRKINESKPDILWVGLGLPKQEVWIFEHKDRLNVPVIVGVGAAFKFLSGRVRRAPQWIGDAGFEWLWRLLFEPKTVIKRIFIDGPIFVFAFIKDVLKYLIK